MWLELITVLMMFAVAMACCCGTCTGCPTYPCLVTISIPSLGISEFAINTLDPSCEEPLPPGEYEAYQYNLEGDFEGIDGRIFTCQCVFQECGFNVLVAEVGGEGFTCYATQEPPLVPQEDYVTCDPLLIVHTVACEEGGTLEIVIEGA